MVILALFSYILVKTYYHDFKNQIYQFWVEGYNMSIIRKYIALSLLLIVVSTIVISAISFSWLRGLIGMIIFTHQSNLLFNVIMDINYFVNSLVYMLS